MCAQRMPRRLGLEKLETRSLLTGMVGTVDLDGGILSIVGSHRDDKVEVCDVNGLLKVSLNKQTFLFATANVESISIDGGRGNDRIRVDGRVQIGATILGGAGHDQIQGGGGDDTISGGLGQDKLSGGGGEDELSGDAGHDQLDGGDGDDVLRGGIGKDEVRGGTGHDQLFGDEGQDYLSGGDGDDWLFGGEGHDYLSGNLGDDRLKGEAGNDCLDGGAGANLLDGDEGRNKFKNGTIVDLDEPVEDWETILVANLVDQSGGGIVAIARFEISGDENASVRRLTVSVNNVPSGTPLQLLVIVEEDVLGNLTIDPTTRTGSFTISDVSIEEGDFIAVGQSLVGQFVAA